MSPSRATWARRWAPALRPAVALEVFIIFNLAFLALDVFLAHRLHLEAPASAWVPFAFSLVAPVGLLVGAGLRGSAPRFAHGLGIGVGAASCLVGGAGLVLHLESRFFQQTTLEGLVYSAPFSAPLAYSGLGIGLLLHRWVPSSSRTWGQWLLALAAGGFAGNFALALADHAQNGFFHWTEWIAVAVAALGVTVGILPARRGASAPEWHAAAAVVALQAVTGILGFGLHLAAIVERRGSFWSNVVYGAPIFAPLLYTDVALLAAIGLWSRREPAPRGPPSASAAAPSGSGGGSESKAQRATS